MTKEFVTKSCSVVLSAIFLLSPGDVSAYAQESYPQQQYPPPSGQYPPPQQYPQGQYPQQPPPQQYPQQQYPQQYPPPQGQPYPPVQSPYGPPQLAPQQLDQLVGPIALYADPLLAQVLTASSFTNEIPDAANWANQHSYLRGPELAAAIQADNLPWDPSVLALLPFPSVLNYMASNMGWTQELGNAVLVQRGDVMDAVQRMRQQAYNYGYLRTNGYYRVIFAGPGDIQIVPVNPDLYYVPVYNPYIVYAPPRRGVAVAAAIGFGAAVLVGAAFRPWGWGHPDLEWRQHAIIIDNRPWNRTWATRGVYARPEYHSPGPRIEHHDVRGPEHSRGGDHRRGDHRDDHR
jgi:hypothetical protein